MATKKKGPVTYTKKPPKGWEADKGIRFRNTSRNPAGVVTKGGDVPGQGWVRGSKGGTSKKGFGGSKVTKIERKLARAGYSETKKGTWTSSKPGYHGGDKVKAVYDKAIGKGIKFKGEGTGPSPSGPLTKARAEQRKTGGKRVGGGHDMKGVKGKEGTQKEVTAPRMTPVYAEGNNSRTSYARQYGKDSNVGGLGEGATGGGQKIEDGSKTDAHGRKPGDPNYKRGTYAKGTFPGAKGKKVKHPAHKRPNKPNKGKPSQRKPHARAKKK